MSAGTPPKKNAIYTFYIALVDQADTRKLKSSATIAAGDFKVSTDGGALANLGTLPVVTPAASVDVKITLSALEMNGDDVVVNCIDAAGAEWADLVIHLKPSTRDIDDLAFPTVSGRSIGVESDGDLTKVNTLDGHTAQTGDSFGRIGATGSGLTTLAQAAVATEARLAELDAANLPTDVDAIVADTSELQTVLSAAILARTNNKNLNALLGVADTAGEDVPGQTAFEVADEVLTGGTHNVVNSLGRRIRDLQEFGVYEGGAIWIDTVNGTPGTTDFESGTVFNPVDTIADANTLAASLGLNRFQIAPGSTITLAAAQNNQVFTGENWTLALGGQDIAGSHFIGADVSGIATGVGTEQDFHNCHLSAITHIDNTFLIECGIEGTQTMPAGDLFFHQCFMATVAGVVPIIDFGAAVLNTDVHLHDWRGRIEFQNLGQAGTDAIHLDGQGKATLNVNCIGGTINWRGAFELVNNGSGITINDDARYDQAQILEAMTSDDVKFQGADIALIKTETDKLALVDAGAGVAGSVIEEVENRALATVATEARLAELDAANLPADVDTIKAAATEARLAELDAANLPADVDTIKAAATEARLAELDAANIPADIDSLITAIITNAVGADVTADLATLKALFDTTAMAEQASGAPSATPTPLVAWMYLYMQWRNGLEQTSTERRLRNAAGTEIADATMSDDGTTFDSGIMTAP